MEIRLTLIIIPETERSLISSSDVSHVCLLFAGDCGEWRRWYYARLRAVEIDDAPVSGEENKRNRRGLEEVAAPNVLADKCAGLNRSVV